MTEVGGPARTTASASVRVGDTFSIHQVAPASA
jgi:hypothetical protein